MDENDQNGTSTENEEAVEIVTEDNESADNNEGTESESEDKKELTDEQKKGIAKRNLKKMLKQYPDLLEEDVKEEPKEEKPTSETLTRAEAILVAKGLDESGLEKVNRIAKLDGISIQEAYESEDFTIWQEKQTREKERKATQLGASGGKKGQSVKTLQSEGLSEEDHKKLFNQRLKKFK